MDELPNGRAIDKGSDSISENFTTITFPNLSPNNVTPPDPTNSAKPIIKATKPRPEVETSCSSSKKVAKVTSIIICPDPKATIATIAFFAVGLRLVP